MEEDAAVKMANLRQLKALEELKRRHKEVHEKFIGEVEPDYTQCSCPIAWSMRNLAAELET